MPLIRNMCHICEGTVDARITTSRRTVDRYEHRCIEIELEYHCAECGFYRILPMRDFLIVNDTQTPWRRLDVVLQEEDE